jgi:membrane associated rhomboid family serine protease
MIIIYLLSGIGGNIFSLACNTTITPRVGASTALYGIIGLILGYIIINWNGFDLVGFQMKCQICCSGFMIIIFIFIWTPSTYDGIDYLGHLGGFLTGLWCTAIHNTIIDTIRERIFRIVFASLLGIQLLICFLVVFLT